MVSVDIKNTELGRLCHIQVWGGGGVGGGDEKRKVSGRSKDGTGSVREISKEMVGNSWNILNAILSHIYHQNHLNRVILSK